MNSPDLEVENEILDINKLSSFIDDDLILDVYIDDNIVPDLNNDRRFFINNPTIQSQKKNRQLSNSALFDKPTKSVVCVSV